MLIIFLPISMKHFHKVCVLSTEQRRKNNFDITKEILKFALDISVSVQY